MHSDFLILCTFKYSYSLAHSPTAPVMWHWQTTCLQTFLICSYVCVNSPSSIQLNSPPWQQNIFSSIIAAIGRQLKQSVNVFHNFILYLRLPATRPTRRTGLLLCIQHRRQQVINYSSTVILKLCKTVFYEYDDHCKFHISLSFDQFRCHSNKDHEAPCLIFKSKYLHKYFENSNKANFLHT